MSQVLSACYLTMIVTIFVASTMTIVSLAMVALGHVPPPRFPAIYFFSVYFGVHKALYSPDIYNLLQQLLSSSNGYMNIFHVIFVQQVISFKLNFVLPNAPNPGDTTDCH